MFITFESPFFFYKGLVTSLNTYWPHWISDMIQTYLEFKSIFLCSHHVVASSPQKLMRSSVQTCLSLWRTRLLVEANSIILIILCPITIPMFFTYQKKKERSYWHIWLLGCACFCLIEDWLLIVLPVSIESIFEIIKFSGYRIPFLLMGEVLDQFSLVFFNVDIFAKLGLQ